MILDTRKTFTYSICTKLHLLKNVYNKIIQFFSLSFFRRTMKVQRWKYHIVLLLSATAFVNDLWFVINMCLKFWPEINCRTLPTKEIKTDIMFHRSKNIAWYFFFHHYICITLPKAIILTPQLSIYANLYYICSCIIQFNCFVLAIFIQSALSTDSLS
jgi:hypothetical protein